MNIRDGVLLVGEPGFEFGDPVDKIRQVVNKYITRERLESGYFLTNNIKIEDVECKATFLFDNEGLKYIDALVDRGKATDEDIERCKEKLIRYAKELKDTIHINADMDEEKPFIYLQRKITEDKFL